MRTLLVATHGGHVSEMVGFVDRIKDLEDRGWVTNPHPQTEIVLSGEEVEYVRLVKSRDAFGVLRALPKALRRLRRGQVGRVVSTGSALALAYLPIAAVLGIPAHYIESCTRVQHPSVTGRILALTPGVKTWWQHPEPPHGWSRLDGLYAHFTTEPSAVDAVRSVVVTVGTTDYCFRRLIARLVDIIPADVEVFWQVGNTDTSDLDITAHKIVDSGELKRQIAGADVVVSHAGAGSLLECLQAGRVPVYVPRLKSQGEQIDDHQVELSDWADSMGLAVTVDASAVSWSNLTTAARKRAVANPQTMIDLER